MSNQCFYCDEPLVSGDVCDSCWIMHKHDLMLIHPLKCDSCGSSIYFRTPLGDVICPDCGKKYELVKPKAVRHNQDKLRVDLIPTELIEEVAKVFTFGAKKYSPNNWKGFTKEQQDEILGSLLRHILEYQKGNKLDSESGLHHLAHAACNIAFILYFENKEK